HRATGNDGSQHDLDGTADVKKRLGTEEAVCLGELEHLAAVVRTPQHSDLIQQCPFGHSRSAGGELDHRDVFGRYFSRRFSKCWIGNGGTQALEVIERHATDQVSLR